MRTPCLLALLLLAACAGGEASPEAGSTDPTVDRVGGDGTDGSDGSDGSDGTDGTEPVELGLDPACSPFNMGGECLTPWPSVFHMEEAADSETGLRLAYQADMLTSPDGDLPVDPTLFNRYDGVSVTSPLLLLLGRDVHPDQLFGPDEEAASLAEGAPYVLVDSETGARIPVLAEMDRNNRDDETYAGRHALILRPMLPLEPGGRYTVGVSTALTDADGAAFDTAPGFAALRDGEITTDARIEAQRDRYESVLFPALDAAGLPRDEVLVAWEVQVASDAQSLGPVLSMRDAALADIEANGLSYTVTALEVAPSDDVALRVEGTFEPPNFLIDNELDYSDDAYSVALQAGDRPSYAFTMSVPAGLPETGAVPLVVMGHGLFGEGRGLVNHSITRALAAEMGVVMVATDFVGLSGGDLDLILTEVLPDVSRVRVITDRLAQSLINTLALVDLARTELQHLPETGRTSEDPLLDDRLYYYGNSLGGIEGTAYVALDDRVSRAVWAVPGAGWTHMIQRSTQFRPIETLLDTLYPDPLHQLLFISALQSDFDAADPINLGRRLPEREGFVGLLQEAVGDCQVPNLTTNLLAHTLDAAHLEAAPRPVWGLEVVAGPQRAGVSLTQTVLPDLLADYTPPDDNTLPTSDNGTHGAGPLTDPSLDQVRAVVVDGEALHLCDGDCDPD